MDHIPFSLSGAVVGIILLQTGVVAPRVFSLLSSDSASVFLRGVFPRFFLLIAVLSGLNAIVVGLSQQFELLIVPCGSMIFALIAYSLIPATNRSRDTGDEERFKLLHRASVGLTLVILILNSVIIAL